MHHTITRGLRAAAVTAAVVAGTVTVLPVAANAKVSSCVYHQVGETQVYLTCSTSGGSPNEYQLVLTCVKADGSAPRVTKGPWESSGDHSTASCISTMFISTWTKNTR